ncbi:hypothetical protein B296_00036563 [Ensete ventricosum]|uniref:O-fucosyltransferase family protein n=1 Tax=Ensete ventricosum TaxID=4639 RepID=A0A426YF70_ENSVE|nr:hypothetical protein B296_00036563 [Ensete ventricosum]
MNGSEEESIGLFSFPLDPCEVNLNLELCNFFLQLAALDFIVCAAADAFAMTDSGSQLSALVSGYRMYYGGGNLPTIRPNKRRLASIFLKNSTIEWKEFEDRVRKTIKQTKQIHERPIARSIYRHPRSPECMCTVE